MKKIIMLFAASILICGLTSSSAFAEKVKGDCYSSTIKICPSSNQLSLYDEAFTIVCCPKSHPYATVLLDDTTTEIFCYDNRKEAEAYCETQKYEEGVWNCDAILK